MVNTGYVSDRVDASRQCEHLDAMMLGNARFVGATPCFTKAAHVIA